VGLNPAIGLSALLAAQSGLDVVGNNIANASTPGYTREVVQLAEAPTLDARNGQVGSGVLVNSTARIADLFLEARVQNAGATSAADTAETGSLNNVQSIVGGTGSGSLSSLLSSWFSSTQALAANPDDAPTQGVVVSSAQELAQGFQQTYAALRSEQSDDGSQVTADVTQANDLASQIATLNGSIRDVQSTGEAPNSLLDQRDALSEQLSALTGATGQTASDGSLTLALGGRLLVAGTSSYALETTQDPTKGTLVRFTGTTQPITLTSGTIGGLLSVASTTIPTLEGQLDGLARAVMQQANQVSSTGVGATPLTSLTTTIPVKDPSGNGDPTDAVLTNAGLPVAPTAGTISVNVTDAATGATTTTAIAFDPSRESLKDLAVALSAVPNVTAKAGADGILQVNAAPGYGFDFADRSGQGGSDAGGVLASLGANPIFTGTGASDMGVAATVVANPGAIATGSAPGIGDGSNVARIADAALGSLQGSSATDTLSSIVSDVGSAAQNASTAATSSGAALASLQDAKSSVSGVSTEEEVANMMQYQNSFQAASRYLSVLSTLAQDLMSMVGT
jgi:flagellar hook-associated protein FlgK